MTSPVFGSSHVPGLLPQPDVQDTAAPCTPAQSGMGPLVPPRLFQRSSCPPLCAEPLTAPPDDGPGIVAARQADRELLCGAQQLMNRLVYDSLQPPVPSAGPAAAVAAGAATAVAAAAAAVPCAGPAVATDCPSAGMGSSCEAAASDSAGSGSSSQAAAAGSLDGPEAAACEYAPGLAPWYTLQGPEDTTLLFESRFESGNLRRAIQVRLTSRREHGCSRSRRPHLAAACCASCGFVCGSTTGTTKAALVKLCYWGALVTHPCLCYTCDR